MKTFEISKKQSKNGRRKFKAILYRIFPDDCVDEEKQVGTQFNENGITWIREYCERALPSIKGMSLRCEFLDEERTELCGHGETEIVDGLPVFENAVVIGTFEDGYIEDVVLPNGETITACIGVGTIDGCCYHNFCEKLEKDINDGIMPSGSVEILKTDDNDSIIYKYGYKSQGRIPMIFEHSGYALIGVKPADPMAKILELNKKNKEELDTMDNVEIKNLIVQTIEELSAHTSEINKCKEECDAKVAEANEALSKAIAEKNEIVASSEQIKAALEQVKQEYDALDKKYNELWEERKALEKALGEAQAKERLGEMNAAIADFTDEEKAYAKAELDAFNENPMAVEINTVVNKIWEGIGKKSKADAEAQKIASEQNTAKDSIEDIFGAVDDKSNYALEDDDIFN